ncbi:unnamed protein product [Rhizophagus irregularis]|nr:unnamed protein product [Rhizophagus irregularis]
MFLDTIYNYRSTEPVWFRFVRGFFAIILMGLIIYYSSIQFQKINKEVTVIFKDIKSDPDKMDYGLNIKMCTGISNEMNIIPSKKYYTSTQINNHTPYYQIVNLNYSLFYYYFPIFSTYSHNTQPLLNITTTLNKLNNYTNRNITYNFDFSFYNISPLNIPNNLLFLSIESFHFIGNIDLPVITFDNERLVNDSENLISLNYKFGRIEPAHFSLYLGQAYFISFNPIIVNDNKLYKLELNPQLEQLPIQLAPNETHIHIYPRSNPRVEIRRMYNFTDFLSNLGGFYGATAGIFYLLFGMQKHEP